MKIMIFNGLLLFLLFMWTSAETGPETVLTEEIQVYANESRVDIQARKRACENLGGKCINKKKDCPSRWHLETKPGKPYCSKNHRCCYPGPSCNLVWNYKEERPLIMIRDSKIIVPPVLDIEVSDNPSRIPIGRKLIFACPGKNNQFNHVEGTHTKLHGECISHEQFKVCVNSNPEILDLSQLSCSRKMFPSFIKDNATSDKKSCDGIGGELYKSGYIYGDYHEFKDLEIEMCFWDKNQTNLCTSPNLNVNETDYRTARGIKDIPGSDPRMLRGRPCGGVGTSCTPKECTFKVDLDVIDVGKCKTEKDGNFKTEVMFHRECILPCKCFIKGCLPRRCNGLQGTCRWTQQQSQVELPGDRVCTNGCKCYMPGCNPRDCKDGNNKPGICSKDGPQGTFYQKAAIQDIDHRCAVECDCYTKGININPNAMTKKEECNDNSIRGAVWGKHVCNQCMMVDTTGGTMTEDAATIQATKVADDLKSPSNTHTVTIFAAGRPYHIEFEHIRVVGTKGIEDACRINKPVVTWQCTKINNNISKYKCVKQRGLHKAKLILGNGHLVEGSVDPKIINL